jgi:nitrogen fixation NifU-like protein
MDDLYQEIILDHYKRPRNFRKLTDTEAMVDEENPTCGDHIKLTASVGQGAVQDVKVDCQGCAICTASSSIMTEMVIKKPVSFARKLIADFTGQMRGEGAMSDDELGELIALKGVTKYPLRVKCATMPWHALEAALNKLGARNT